jgi:adenine phosphoribosyltransferase
MNLKNYIPVVPNWPKPGVDFLDITGLLNEPTAFNYSVNQLSLLVRQANASSIVAVESRGFIFASPVAKALGLPLIIVRKPNKLPGDVHTITYDTEYSTDSLSIKSNAPVGLTPYIVDDLLATGGTILATAQLLRDHFTVESISAGAVIGLDFLPGRNNLSVSNITVNTLINYE